LNDVTINQDAVDELMRDEHGPVGDLMRDLARQMAAVAIEKVRVRGTVIRKGVHRTGRTSNAQLPGYTKAHITYTVGHAKLSGGVLFGGAESPGDPGLFLELPAEQMHEKYPFLTTGLWSVHVD
jgi:hypothetical protein